MVQASCAIGLLANFGHLSVRNSVVIDTWKHMTLLWNGLLFPVALLICKLDTIFDTVIFRSPSRLVVLIRSECLAALTCSPTLSHPHVRHFSAINTWLCFTICCPFRLSYPLVNPTKALTSSSLRPRFGPVVSIRLEHFTRYMPPSHLPWSVLQLCSSSYAAFNSHWHLTTQVSASHSFTLSNDCIHLRVQRCVWHCHPLDSISAFLSFLLFPSTS